MEFHITPEQFFGVLFVLIAAAIFVTNLVDALKKAGVVKDGAAGKANQVLSAVIAFAGFALTYFGQGERVADAQALGLDLSLTLISTYLIAFIAFVVHQVKRLIEGRLQSAAPLVR